MENSKEKNLIKKIDEPNVVNFNPLPYLVNKYVNLSNYTFGAISIVSSFYMTYKYLANKDVYTEYNGHFNSPKNQLNKKMTIFYLQDSVIRIGLGMIFVGGGLILTKILLMKYYLKNENEFFEKFIEKNLNESKKENELTTTTTNIIEGTYYKNLITLTDYELGNKKEHQLDDTIRRQKIVNNISK